MPEISDDLVYGWTASKCEECDAVIIQGHDWDKSSGCLFVPRCIAIDKKHYTCNGRMVEGEKLHVVALLKALGLSASSMDSLDLQ